MKTIILKVRLGSRVAIFPCSRMKTIFLNVRYVIKAPSEIRSNMSQTSKAQGDANMTLKLKDDMMKNLKMLEDVTKTLKMSDAIKTSEVRGDTI